MKEELYSEIFVLKNLVRTGWKMRNVTGRQESDAEHTFSMLMLGLEIMNKHKLKLDQLKVLKMIIYHELGEIDVGDYTLYSGVSKADKYAQEHVAIKRLSQTYNMPEIEELWLEFEDAKTPEAIFVKKLDKYDAVKQAEQYVKNHQCKPDVYTEFRNNAKSIADEFDKYFIE